MNENQKSPVFHRLATI